MTDVGNGLETREGGTTATPLGRPAAGELKTLRDAVVDAAAVSAGLWFSYLLVLFYLLVGVAGVTQRDLLLSDIVTLPFLSGVQLPLRGFAALGPIIFVVTHAYVMLHLSMLASKVAAFDAALARVEDSGTRAQARGELPLNIFVQLFAGPDEVQRGPIAVLLGLAATISLVIGPMGLLVFFVLQFLPGHDEGVTWLQRLMVLADLVLLWLLGPPIVNRTRRWPRRRTVASGVALGAMIVVSLVVLQIVFEAATFRGERLYSVVGAWPWRGPAWGRQRLWSDHLVLDHANLSGDARLGAGSVASLEGRSLERARLSNTIMQRFDFMDADLRGAVLDYSQLQGSNLNGARLEGASLAGVKLHGASLERAHLAGANLASAQLQGANLLGADLRGANLDHAQLQGALLENASLDGAILDDAQLQGASLKNANLMGASLQKAFVWRADPTLPNVTDARIGDLITERRVACADTGGCSWPDPFGDLKRLIGLHLSDDDSDSVVKRLQAQFVPLEQPDLDVKRGDNWNKWSTSAADDYARIQLFSWSMVGCARKTAPFVATQMTRTLTALQSQNNTQVAAIAHALLKPTCKGARGITAQTRAMLTKMDNQATQATPMEVGLE